MQRTVNNEKKKIIQIRSFCRAEFFHNGVKHIVYCRQGWTTELTDHNYFLLLLLDFQLSRMMASQSPCLSVLEVFCFFLVFFTIDPSSILKRALRTV